MEVKQLEYVCPLIVTDWVNGPNTRIQLTPVIVAKIFRRIYEHKTKISPAIAKVIVFLAVSNCFESPLAKIYRNPAYKRSKNDTVPAAISEKLTTLANRYGIHCSDATPLTRQLFQSIALS